MKNPEFVLYEQFYKLENSKEDFQDYLERKLRITPFDDGYHKIGFIAVIEGLLPTGTLLCLRTDADYWKGLFYNKGEIQTVFDTETKPDEQAKELATALFSSLENKGYIVKSSDQQFSIHENWKEPIDIQAHWIGRVPK